MRARSAALRKTSGVGCLPVRKLSASSEAPGFVGDAAKREAGGLDGIALHFEASRYRDQREGVAMAVAHFDVLGVLRKFGGGSSTAVMSSPGAQGGLDVEACCRGGDGSRAKAMLRLPLGPST